MQNIKYIPKCYADNLPQTPNSSQKYNGRGKEKPSSDRDREREHGDRCLDKTK